MPRDFIPRRDVDFLSFTTNFRAKISAPPPFDPASLGLTPQQVAHYAITQQAFADAWKLASQPGTRTVVSVEGKNASRKTLEAETRALAAIIRSHPGVTETTLCGLSMCVPTQRRRHVGPPATAPRMRVSSESGRRVKVQLGDVDAPTLRKPRDAWNADIFAFVGDNPPNDMSHGSGWKYVKSVTRTRTTVTFSARVRPGTKVWLAANWSNWRGERGPICQPMCAHLSYGGPMKEGAAEVSAVAMDADVESTLRFAPGKPPSPAAAPTTPLLILNAA